jgi:putative hydrolase of HD superfamily
VQPTEAAGIARFFHRIGALKLVHRTGWLDRGVPIEETESVADHSFRMALLAWLTAFGGSSGLDADRVLKLALLHDLAEALTGDEPPYAAEAVPAEDGTGTRRAFLQQAHVRSPERSAAKQAAEAAAMADLLSDLPPKVASELRSLWSECQAQASPESRFVKQADRLETYLQAQEYLAEDTDRPMASFATEVTELIAEPDLRRVRDAITQLRLDQRFR